MRSRIYLNLGLVSELLGHYNEAKTYLNLSIQLNQWVFNRREDSIIVYDVVYDIINRRHNLFEDLFRSQFSLASVYEKSNETEKSLNAFEEVIKTSKLLKNKTYLCDALMAKAIALMRLRKFEESRKLFKKAHKLKSPIQEDREKIERCLVVSTFICDDFKQLNRTQDLENKIRLCDRLGDHFVELRLFNLSIEFYKKELNFAVQCNKCDAEISKIYVSIAQTYADDARYEEAIEYFNHELNCNRGNGVEECKSLMKIAEMKEYLRREELNEEIVRTYETAIERIESETDFSKPLLIDILQRFIAFIESREISCDLLPQLRDKLKLVRCQTKELVDVEENIEPDIYESFDLNDISDCSSDSDEELPSLPKSRRMGKNLKRNEKGETPLHLAAIDGNVKQVKKLLADKHPVNVRDYTGWTPLHEAANNGHKEIVQILLESGANINDNEGEKTDAITPLHDACSNGHFDVIRVLLNSGAKVTLLTNSNETALDLLREWKKRSESELDDNDLKEFKRLDKQLEDTLNKEGFSRKNIPIIKASAPKSKIHIPLIRGRHPSPDSDDSLETSDTHCQKFHSTNRANDLNQDFDNPRVARKEYCSTISKLRRDKDNRSGKAGPKTSTSVIPALLDGRNAVNDEWLINDMNETKKRSCLDAYDALTKRSKTSVTDDSVRRHKTKSTSNDKQELAINSLIMDSEMNSDDSDALSEIESIESVEITEQKNDSINESEESLSVNIKNDKENVERTHFKPIQLRVCVRDSDNTTLVIPILTRSSNCLWLNKEVEKRYFSKFGVKPNLSLETTDGALLSDEDFILDVITGQELKVIAKIDSWALDPLHLRYKQVCDNCGVTPMPDIVDELQITQINGCLRLSDINIPVEHIKPIFRALQRQNYFKEIVILKILKTFLILIFQDISCSNIVFDDSFNFFSCLSLLPSLQILNLKCTAMSLQSMEQLAANSCPNLVDLNLSFNTFGDNFNEVIVKVIEKFQKLNSIDLSACDLTQRLVDSNQFNECLKSKLQFISVLIIQTINNWFAFKDSNLRSVVLAYNPIDCELIDKFRCLWIQTIVSIIRADIGCIQCIESTNRWYFCCSFK